MEWFCTFWLSVIWFISVCVPRDGAVDGINSGKTSIFEVLLDISPTDMEDADNSCRGLGDQYGLPTDQTDREDLREVMRQHNITSIWLALQKTSYKTWTWVDGTQANASSIRHERDFERCGAISVPERKIIPVECNYKNTGFVCEVKENRGCTVKHFTQSCIQTGSKTYFIGCNSQSWEEGRGICSRHQADLAIIDNAVTMDTVLNYIIDGKYSQSCSWVYIGISKEEWKLSRTNPSGPHGSVNWTVGEPRSDGSCAQLVLNEGTNGWRSVQCRGKAPVLCQNYAAQRIDRKIPVPPAEKFLGIPGVAGLGFVGGLLLTLFIVTCALGLLYRFRHLEFPKLCSRKNQGQEEEAVPLNPVGQGNNRPIGDAPGSDAPNLKKWMDFAAINKAKGNQIAIGKFTDRFNYVCLSSQLSTEAEEFRAILKRYTRDFDSHPNMVIFNLPLDAFSNLVDPQILEDTLKRLLQYGLDIIFIPNMDIPSEKNVIELLHELRQKTVLVCSVQRKLPAFPASEIISFAPQNGDAKLNVSTGFIDIWVPNEEKIDRTIGLIAGLLHIARINNPNLYEHLRNTKVMRELLKDCLSKANGQSNLHSFTSIAYLEITPSFRDAVLGILADIIAREQRRLVTTETDLIEALRTLKPAGKDPLRIVIAGSLRIINGKKEAASAPPTRSSESPAKTFEFFGENTSPDKCQDFGTGFLMQINRRLKKVKSEGVIAIAHIIYIEENIGDRYRSAIKPIEAFNADIVYISPSEKAPTIGYKRNKELADLCEKSVVITGARPYESQLIPPTFPSESVICAGREGGPMGSCLDFISTSHQEGDLSDEAWMAGVDTICTAAAVLMKATEPGHSNDVCNKLKNTQAMRNILIHMCSHFPESSFEDGFGILQPSRLLVKKTKQFANLLENPYAGSEKYWIGRNVGCLHA